MAAEQGRGTPVGGVPALDIERICSTTVTAGELARALADRTGAKPVMVGGLVLFSAASAAFVIGGDPQLLGAARLAQGTGTAEAGRELGDAGGPVLVGAFGLVSPTAGLGALAPP